MRAFLRLWYGFCGFYIPCVDCICGCFSTEVAYENPSYDRMRLVTDTVHAPMDGNPVTYAVPVYGAFVKELQLHSQHSYYCTTITDAMCIDAQTDASRGLGNRKKVHVLFARRDRAQESRAHGCRWRDAVKSSVQLFT